jgi:predicted CXXCH cytochrome family protein
VCRDAPLAVGDSLQIGSNVLKFVVPPEEFDLAFTFELDANVDTRAIEAQALPMALSLREVGARIRPWAWILFTVVLMGALVIPWLSSPQSGALLPTRQTALPSDHAWQSGPLHSAHANLGAKCEACHVRPFERVADKACLSCHASSLHRHVALQNLELPALASTRCATCHREHNEPSTLVRNDEQICVSCHAKPQAGSSMSAVTDFQHDHPAFAAAASKDNSQLKFSHQVHLDQRGIKTTTGEEIMTCGSCHEPQPAGARFQPISMQRHCQRCHALSFDPREPERNAPHAAPAIVLQSLLEYYAAEYLQGYPDTLNAARPVRKAERPGVDLSALQRTRVLARARTEAEIAARDLLERRACPVCHEVRRGKVASSWTVAPVTMRTAWMPKAAFSHVTHATSLTPCKTCHNAATSKLSTDLLMPKIETCRDCHAGSHSASTTQIASSCTSCHGFHNRSNPLWDASSLPTVDSVRSLRQ